MKGFVLCAALVAAVAGAAGAGARGSARPQVTVLTHAHSLTATGTAGLHAGYVDFTVRNVPEWGGGALLDVGCYPVTVARWLFGAEPTAVIGTLERDPEFGVDRLTTALLRFPTGMATFTVGSQIVHAQRVQIYGTTGRIELRIPFSPPSDWRARILVDDGRDVLGGGVETIELDPVDQFTRQADRFVEAIRGMGDVPVPLEDAVGNMAVLDAIFRSIETGRWEAPGEGGLSPRD